ncbi:hypothetical protein [Ferrovibrio sp.]|uniref:hypothetical protein n=1 Tax=Ferrovibrio sp. TaxID=1917215 RepID=UPI0025B9ABC6|nr:hypothetical protein [Ferrovibrio sp.]MBX3453562.1 hypothetical protein [Ferrovibrio sp.]
MLRRHLLSTFAVTAAGGLAALSRPASAMSMEELPQHLRRNVEPRADALDWDLLAQAGETRFIDGEMSRFPAALRSLHGRDVDIYGYMMPFREAPQHAEFLLGALQFHCAGCLVSDLSRIVAVRAAAPVEYSTMPVQIHGRLSLIEQEQSPLYFRLDGAKAA